MAHKEFSFFLKHSTIYGLGTIIGQFVSFIMLPIYTRHLSPKDYGVLNLIEISTFLLGIVITTGIAQTLSRFYFDHSDGGERNKIVSTMYMTYGLLALIAAPIFYFAIPLLSQKVLGSLSYIHWFQVSFLSLILGGLLDIGLAYLRIVNRSGFFALISLSRLTLLLSMNIYFIVYKGLGVLGILYSVLITRIIFQLILTVPIFLKIRSQFSLEYSISMLKFSLPLIPARLASTFVNQSDRYFIRYFLSIADTGIYSLAQKLGTAIHLIVTCSFQSAYEPRRFEIVKKEDAKHTFNKIFIYHALILVFCGLGLSIFVPEILRLMVTPKFYAAGKYVPLIVFSMILFGFRNHFEFGILWSKKTKYYAYANAIAAALNLVLNFILISRLGLFGAIYSSIIVIMVHNTLIYIYAKNSYYIRYEFKKIFRMFLIAIPIYGLSLMIQTDRLIVDILFKLCLLCLFPVGLVLLRVVNREEIDLTKNYMKSFGLKLNKVILRSQKSTMK